MARIVLTLLDYIVVTCWLVFAFLSKHASVIILTAVCNNAYTLFLHIHVQTGHAERLGSHQIYISARVVAVIYTYASLKHLHRLINQNAINIQKYKVRYMVCNRLHTVIYPIDSKSTSQATLVRLELCMALLILIL